MPPSPWRAPRAPFVVLSLAVVSIGLLALLGLNTVVAQNAFTLDKLERRSAALAADEQRLEREVAALEAPDRVAVRAQSLGLVPASDPAFLRLADGMVLGVPRAATAPPKPRPKPVVTQPAVTAKAKPASQQATAATKARTTAPKPAAPKTAPVAGTPAPTPSPATR